MNRTRKSHRMLRAMEQLSFLLSEVKLVVNRKSWRWLTIWFGGCAWINISYRIDRLLFLIFGKNYPAVRPIFAPCFLAFAFLGGRHEIHYRAEIGRGLKIWHSSLGTVVSGFTVAGEYLTLTGGNIIGARKSLRDGDIQIGSNVFLGGHATVLGPVKVGDNVEIGAGAVVVSDIRSGVIVAGVPARELGTHASTILQEKKSG